jgi:hypothetical protein
MWRDLDDVENPEAPIYYNIAWMELLADMERRLEQMGGSVF